jgi:hypothetical protein
VECDSSVECGSSVRVQRQRESVAAVWECGGSVSVGRQRERGAGSVSMGAAVWECGSGVSGGSVRV